MNSLADLLTAFGLGAVLGAFVAVMLLGFLGMLGVPF